MEAHRQPKFQRAEAAREFHRLFEKCESLNRVKAELLRISTRVSESLSSDLGIAIEKAATIKWLKQPFMRVERDRIRFAQAAELFRCGERSQCPVGAINVQPQIGRTRKCGDLRQRIDRACIHGAG